MTVKKQELLVAHSNAGGSVWNTRKYLFNCAGDWALVAWEGCRVSFLEDIRKWLKWSWTTYFVFKQGLRQVGPKGPSNLNCSMIMWMIPWGKLSV